MAEMCGKIECGTSVSMSDVDFSNEAGHPNAAPFSGTLLLLDEPSDQPPHGAEGHRILVPKNVAEDRLKTLPGMAINYQSDLEGHNPSKKVGVITQASVSGNKVKVKGIIWKKDFPDALRTFKSNSGALGMSMELGDVYVQDKDDPVWRLEDFHFTGATVLLKDHAAYESTDLAASKHFVKALAAARTAMGHFEKGGKRMAKDTKEKEAGQSKGELLSNAISAAVEKSFNAGLKPFIDAQEKTNQSFSEALKSISAAQEELAQGLHELALGNVEAALDEDAPKTKKKDINAAWPKKGGGDATMQSDASDPSMAAKSNASDASDATDASDPSMNADASATGDLDPTNYSDPNQSSDAGSDKSEPGDLNEDATSNARSQSKGGSNQMKPGGASHDPGIAAGSDRKRTHVAEISAAAKAIRTLQAEKKTLYAEREQLVIENKKLRNRVGAIEASLDRYAERVERKSITPEISALMEKSGYDVRELMSSKQRLSVSDVDTMLASGGISLEPSMRAAFKNQLLQLGLMETGEVKRFQ
jgi:regulator of replication initiation timing